MAAVPWASGDLEPLALEPVSENLNCTWPRMSLFWGGPESGMRMEVFTGRPVGLGDQLTPLVPALPAQNIPTHGVLRHGA